MAILLAPNIRIYSNAMSKFQVEPQRPWTKNNYVILCRYAGIKQFGYIWPNKIQYLYILSISMVQQPQSPDDHQG